MGFCKSCGAEVGPETRFCNSCGAPVAEESVVDTVATYRNTDPTPISERPAEPYATGGMYTGMPPVTPEPRMIVEPKKSGIGAASVFNIILGIIIVLLIGTIVFLFFHFKDDPDPEPVPVEETTTEIKLSVDEYSASTADYEYTISGKYTVKGCSAKLVIKGADGTVEKTIEAGAEDKTWEQEVSLHHYGENTFEIEIYDPENKDETLKTETVVIKRLKYLAGTKLAKACGYNNMLLIRSTPEKIPNDGNVKYKIPGDAEGKHTMTCLGEEVISGGYTWAKVEVVGLGIEGWVGTDGNVRVISTP